jgi:quercetin dioxygenase-like cupin family protein
LEKPEFEKSKPFHVAASVEYGPGSTTSKSIITKTTGNIVIVFQQAVNSQPETTSPFDSFVHVIDGEAVVTIDDDTYTLQEGHAIIIPAHTRRSIRANEKFKMLVTVIKSGYEE